MKPEYLVSVLRLPVIPKSKQMLEVGGSFLVGEGKYAVDWVLLDEAGGVCRKRWNIEAKLGRGEQKVKVALPPHTVSDLSLRGVPRPAAEALDARPVRVTVMMHAAPMSLRRTRLRASDKMALLGTLSSMLQRVRTSSVRSHAGRGNR